MSRFIVSTPSALDKYIWVDDTSSDLRFRVDYDDVNQEEVRRELAALLNEREGLA